MRHALLVHAAVTALAGLLAACGQTGALYLPDEGVTTPVEIRAAPAAPPAEPATPPAEPATPPAEPATPPAEPATPPAEPATPPGGPAAPGDAQQDEVGQQDAQPPAPQV